MDNTKEYIKMCEKVPWVKHKFKLGDFFYCYKDKKVKILTNFEEIITPLVPAKLYRQDQLQEMVINEWGNYHELILDFARWCQKISFTSMEQLWLAFVMKKKYSKQWDGKDWVK